MSKIFNIDFREGILGPNAQSVGGFYRVDFPVDNNASISTENSQGRLGGYGLKIVSDSRSVDDDGLTTIGGYDIRPLDADNQDADLDGALMVNTHPIHPQNLETWWYSFSFKIDGSAWAKGRGFEPYVYEFLNTNTGFDDATILPVLSLSIDDPGEEPYSIDDWFRSSTTPRLFINHLVPSTLGNTASFFNNEANYSHAELGQLSFDTWYDVKMKIKWSAFGEGFIELWVKSSQQTQFTDAPTYVAQKIQNLTQDIFANAGEAYLKVGYSARLNNETSLNHMSNTLYFDNIIGGSNELDVDIFAENISLPGKIILYGGWDAAVSTGTQTNSDQVLAGDWIGYNIAPSGFLAQGTASTDARHSITVENTDTQNSPYAARFEVRDGDEVNSRETSEVYGDYITTSTAEANKIPNDGGTAWFSWSSKISNLWESDLSYGNLFELRNPDDTVVASVGIKQDLLFLRIDRHSADTVDTIYPWGIDISAMKETWFDVKIKSVMSPSDAYGSVNLWLNGSAQVMNYPLGTAAWSGGYNTTSYLGRTLKQSGTVTSNVYPALGLMRESDVADIWIVHHDNMRVSYEDGIELFVPDSIIYPYDISSDSEVNTPDIGTANVNTLGKASTGKSLDTVFITPGSNQQVLITDGGLAGWIDFSTLFSFIPSAPQEMPIAALLDYAGSTAPDGWLLCDGSAISRTTYANLFAVIGTQYGAGDGSTTFLIPDLRGRVAPGKDNMGGTSANRLTGGTALGATGGAQTHTLTSTEMPSHTHTQNAHNHGVSDSGHTHAPNSGSNFYHSGISRANPGVGTGAFDFSVAAASTGLATTGISINVATATNQNTGGGGSHNNLQPYLVLNKIIKY